MNIDALIEYAESKNSVLFKKIDEIALFNQEKVLNAFKDSKISEGHFSQSTGYGYNDDSKIKLCELFSKVFHTEDALVSPHFASGTHTISCALFGIFRPYDKIICITGKPYDTLNKVIYGQNIGSLSEFGIEFKCIDLIDGAFDYNHIANELKIKHAGIYIQRSPGYETREALTIAQIKKVIDFIKQYSDAPILVDNCYGEFVDELEPSDVGADIVMGSLIKNPGGGIAPTGGYIAGKKRLVELASMRLSAPGIGSEIGSFEGSYRPYFEGLFLAPHVVAQARKGGILIATALEELGYTVFPPASSFSGDIVRVVNFNNKDKMIKFCQEIQAYSPIDSFAKPIPWAMPGYDDEVIMASGSFVQGSSIELSADAPVREPFALYVQGGITYEHTKIALKNCLKSIID